MADEDLPITVESAVRILRDVIPDQELSVIAEMAEMDLVDLHLGLGLWIRNAFGLWKDGSALREATGERDPDDAALAIIRALWRSLRGERGCFHLGVKGRDRWRTRQDVNKPALGAMTL